MLVQCKGRAWPEDTFLADECQTCARWVAHYCHDVGDDTAIHQEPPTARECPTRLAVAECEAPNVGIEPPRSGRLE